MSCQIRNYSVVPLQSFNFFNSNGYKDIYRLKIILAILHLIHTIHTENTNRYC